MRKKKVAKKGKRMTETKEKGMTASAEETKPKNVSIERGGDKIILPPSMSYKDAREWLTRQEQAEETIFQVNDNIDCFPLDGVVALSRALNEKFGFTDIMATPGFWGPQPPYIVQVKTVDGFESAPMGRLAPPKWEGGYLQPVIQGPRLTIGGQLKRKFELEVKEILALTRKLLAERSIYKGQAFDVDLSWYDQEEDFDVIKHQPKFMKLAGNADLILNKRTEFELATSVYMLLENADACKKNGINMKHGALFAGKFGTGKTLTAKVLAQKAVANGWTFIYLRGAHQLANGLRVAKMYAPSVVFAEDVDSVVRARNLQMNDLLNVLDGVDTKDAPIMCILTTNEVELIDPSFLRAGRIDTLIKFEPPDAETAQRFVRFFGGRLIAENQDFTKLGVMLQGMASAFVSEVVGKAKRYTIYRTGKADIDGMITSDDLEQAADSVGEHIRMMEKPALPQSEIISRAVRTVHTYGRTGAIPAELVQGSEE